MPKESLYCIPYDQNIQRNANGIVYHCQKEEDKKQTVSTRDSSTSGSNKCKVCKKEFKDARCLKIHKTKMNHWGSSIDSVNNGRKRRPKKEKNKTADKKPVKKRKRSDTQLQEPDKRIAITVVKKA